VAAISAAPRRSCSSPNGVMMVSMVRISSTLRNRLVLVAVLSVVFCLPGGRCAQAQSTSSGSARILTPQDVGKIMPPTVFFRGQTANVQLRNTFGLRFPDGALMLAGLVDSSGYSTGIKEKYQGYILSETTLTVDGRTLLPGAYGFGFLASNDFVAMNIGAHDVLKVAYQSDAALSHPRPLMIVAGKHAGSYRLYEGRKYVSIRTQQ
jgi:hypothetical protein